MTCCMAYMSFAILRVQGSLHTAKCRGALCAAHNSLLAIAGSCGRLLASNYARMTAPLKVQISLRSSCISMHVALGSTAALRRQADA